MKYRKILILLISFLLTWLVYWYNDFLVFNEQKEVITPKLEKVKKVELKQSEIVEDKKSILKIESDLKIEIDTKEILVFSNAKVTTYNPDHKQTDSSPCVNSSTYKKLKEKYWEWDLCILNEKGLKTIALPQDRLDYVYKYLWQRIPTNKITFSPWDKVRLEDPNNPVCNWEFIVWDAFNKRYNWTERIDLFMSDRSKNTSCNWTKMYKIIENKI